MANTIRIKRRASGNAGAPTSLENAELAYNEVDDILYYGKGTGGAGGSATTTPAIAGSGAFATLTGTQTISGNKTFTGTVDSECSDHRCADDNRQCHCWRQPDRFRHHHYRQLKHRHG